jgi:hypothetical protein
MVKPTIRKIEHVRSVAGYNKGFLTLLLAAFCAMVFLIHEESSRAKPAELTAEAPKVTVERIPTSEARQMGVVSRNN